MTTYLQCESAPCNAGHSALVREAAAVHAMPNVTAEMRDEAERHARGQVPRQLATTPHVRCGTTRRGGIAFSLYQCSVCQHERVFGNSVTWES
jgi:hypothetical protein